MKCRFLLSLLFSTLVGANIALGQNPEDVGARPFVTLKLGSVRGLAVDKAGNLYVADPEAGTLHRVTPAGEVSVVPTAPVPEPFAVAVDAKGSIVIADPGRHGVFRLEGDRGSVPLLPSAAGHVFHGPTTLAFDAAGNLFIGENDANVVTKVTPVGQVSILAGRYEEGGNRDGQGAEARITRPRGLAVDRAGNVYVADDALSIIRRITPSGYVTTVAGQAGKTGGTDGRGALARFDAPRGLAIDRGGNVYVMDSGNHVVRKVSPDGAVTTVAGRAGARGFVDGPAADARFAGPRAAAMDATGNLYVADSDNGAVRMITPDGEVRTLVAAQPPPVVARESGGRL